MSMTNARTRSRTWRAAALIAAVAVLVAGCDLIGLATPDPNGNLARRVEAGLVRWREAGIDDYAFTVRLGCFCPPQVTGPFSVTVLDGAVVDVRTEDGRRVPAGDLMAPTTIEAVFERASRALAGDTVDIELDPAWGFPVRITADPITDAIDDEWGLEVTNFRPGG
jgi:hypothetical protein